MFFIASIFITWQLHVYIIKVILCRLQKKVNISAKMSGLGKLHVEFDNKYWNNTSQPHCMLHPASCKRIKLCLDKITFK